jgi:hypothetical protein
MTYARFEAAMFDFLGENTHRLACYVLNLLLAAACLYERTGINYHTFIGMTEMHALLCGVCYVAVSA